MTEDDMYLNRLFCSFYLFLLSFNVHISVTYR